MPNSLAPKSIFLGESIFLDETRVSGSSRGAPLPAGNERDTSILHMVMRGHSRQSIAKRHGIDEADVEATLRFALARLAKR